MNEHEKTKKIIFKRIKIARERLGISQVALAEMAGVSRASVVNWENAKRVPSIGDLETLAGIFKTSISFLIGETDDISTKVSGSADCGERGQTANVTGEPVNLDIMYAALKSARECARYTKRDDLVMASQILQWAISELENEKDELPFTEKNGKTFGKGDNFTN
jgi:transcriptional regulator with XRE-family HTH domain